MASTLVGYSSGEEESNQGPRRLPDANYDDVKMDMSSDDDNDDDESGMFASKKEYKEYKRQFSAKTTSSSEYGPGSTSSKVAKNHPSKHKGSRDSDEEDSSSQSYLESLKKEQERERRELSKQGRESPESHSRRHHKDKRNRNHPSRDSHHHRRRSRSRERRRRSRSRSSRSRSRDRRDSRSHSGAHDRNKSRGSERQDSRNRKLQSLGLVNAESGSGSYESQLEKVKEITGVEVPKYYNPSVINPLRYAEQIKKRQMLWSKKSAASNEQQPEPEPAPVVAPKAVHPPKAEESTSSGISSFNKWEATNFGNDKTNEKFRRLMGIKGSSAAAAAATASASTSSLSSVTNQGTAKWFADQEEQYERARAITHTQRGLGLGFSGGTNSLGMAETSSAASSAIIDKKQLSFVKK